MIIIVTICFQMGRTAETCRRKAREINTTAKTSSNSKQDVITLKASLLVLITWSLVNSNDLFHFFQNNFYGMVPFKYFTSSTLYSAKNVFRKVSVGGLGWVQQRKTVAVINRDTGARFHSPPPGNSLINKTMTIFENLPFNGK